MGTYIDFSGFITITQQTNSLSLFHEISYEKLDPELIIQDHTITRIQINELLPLEAYLKIEQILSQREDIILRLYGMYDHKLFDLNILKNVPHLQRLTLDFHLADQPKELDCSPLCELSQLKSLSLSLFDFKDYSFIQGLNPQLEKLFIHADTMKGGIQFDCDWLLRFKKLNKLYLGVKAKKHIHSIAKLPHLKDLTIRGIKLDNLSFLKENHLKSLAIKWCSMSDLSSLKDWDLKYLELWRIMKLEDLSFVSTLHHLETLK